MTLDITLANGVKGTGYIQSSRIRGRGRVLPCYTCSLSTWSLCFMHHLELEQKPIEMSLFCSADGPLSGTK